jgi:hypothetical protein
MQKNYFHSALIKGLQKYPLTQQEILEGNRLFLKFMELDSEKSEEWIRDCAQYDKSWDKLMEVALKIFSFWAENGSDINGLRSQYKHLMFHEVLNFNNLYRRSIKFVEQYNEWLSQQI